MNATKKASRTIGVLAPILMVLGAFTNFALLGPVFAPPGFLQNAAAQPAHVAAAVLLGIVAAGLNVGIAVAAMPVFRPRSEAMAYWLLALATAGLALAAVEGGHLMSLLSLSQAYAGASAEDREALHALRGVVAAGRNWAHYTGLLVTGGFVFVLFATLWRFALVPRVLAGFGALAALLQVVAVTMPLFGHAIVFAMLAPLGVSFLALAAWLLAKGFAEHDPGAVPTGRRPA